MALPSPVVEPPPTATTASAPRSRTTCSAFSVASTGVCMTAPAWTPTDEVAEQRGDLACLGLAAAGRGEDEDPAHAEALDLGLELGDGARAEHHAGRKGFVDEGLHGSLLQHRSDDDQAAWVRNRSSGRSRSQYGSRPSDFDR